MSEPVFYAHRINTPEALDGLPASHGLELDLRVNSTDIICAHDPFKEGPRMEDYLPLTKGRPLILNVKCEGIVDRVLECCRRHGLEDFFFLGLGLSDTVKLVKAGETRVANYYSEFHHVEEPLAWAGRVGWLWMDTFHQYPADEATWEQLSESFRLCVGSPELYGFWDEARETRIETIRGRTFHAVCGKRTDPWLSA